MVRDQNDATAISFLAAELFFLRRAKRVRFGLHLGDLLLALSGPLSAIWIEEASPYVAAVAGAWLLATRVLANPFLARWLEVAADAHQLFDSYVFDTSWNSTVAPKPESGQILSAATRLRERRPDLIVGLMDWYPSTAGLPQWDGVLVCQRASLGWGARLHREWDRVLLGVAATWLGLTAALGLALGQSLAEFGLGLLLPVLPAVVTSSDEAGGHRRQAGKRAYLLQLIDQNWQSPTRRESEVMDLVERIASELWHLRRAKVLVPEWYYRMRRPAYERNMEDVAQEMRRTTPVRDV